MKAMKLMRVLACTTAILAIVGCGGEDGPAPAPVATGTPSPTPTPTPTPSGSADLKFAGARIGEIISGPMACSDGQVTRSSDGGIVGISQVNLIKIDNSLDITYRAVDSYATEINGFGGSSWLPSDKRPAPNQWFARYANPQQGELLLAQFDLGFATLGQENSSALCFFAAGIRAQTIPTAGVVDYFGITDGFGVINGVPKRLLYWQTNGTAPELVIDFGKREGNLSFNLMARSDPFGRFETNAFEPLGTITAKLRLDQLGNITLSSSDFTGTMTGGLVSNDQNVLGTGGAGAVFVFELRRANGDFVYGSIALAANII